MRRHSLPFNQLDEIGGVQNKQQRPQNRSLRHTAQQTGDERPESAATYVLCPTDEIRPKPPMSNAADAEGPLQTLQQNVVIDGVEGSCQIEENQNTQIATIDSL
jgi:hypothetical protein